MPVEPVFLNDKLESLVRKCIVFPANGSETCIVPMIARTVTSEDDITSLRLHSRCVDMASTFGDEYRKTQVVAHKSTWNGIQITYLFFYNLSPHLPINLNVAHVIGVTPHHLKTKKRLFWRGDLVLMKVQPESELDDWIVESLDADMSELRPLEEFLREVYQEGGLESNLDFDEYQWKSYLKQFCGPTSFLLGAPNFYWGTNAAEKEERFLHDLNELRCVVGRSPLPRPAHMKPSSEHAVTLCGPLLGAFKSTFGLQQTVTGPPKLPQGLERQIFETCALESPDFCTVLVLVARRVNEWIDPILIATVCIMDDFERDRDMPELFLAKLTNGKPVDYYAQHLKNLAILGGFFQTETVNRILAICTGVENLVVLAPCDTNLFKNPRAGRNLRRLTINLGRHFDSMPNFYHACFAHLTHLHLWDEDWAFYTGWENLASLTHLAFACASPPQVVQLMQKLPSVRYVALGHYRSGERYKYADVTVNNEPHIRRAWGVRVVFLREIPEYDWERGARGEGDFWNVVEQEVERRLGEGSLDSVD